MMPPLNASPPRMPVKDMITLGCAMVGAIIVVGGTIRADGVRSAKIDDNTRRIEVLEGKSELLRQIDGRTIRIETKLEMISPTPKEPGQ